MYKTIRIMTQNPLLIILPAAAVLLLALSYVFMQPDINGMINYYERMTDFESFIDNIDFKDTIQMLTITLKIGLLSLVYCIFLIVFIAGYGNMQAAAVNCGKATFRIFFYGIKKFTGKVILSFLLLLGVMYGFSFALSLFTTPIIAANVFREGPFQADIFGMQRALQIFMLVIMTFAYPFLILWLPAIFLDRQEGVVACFKNGLRAGTKRYFKVLPVIAAMMLPTMLLYVLSDNMFTVLKSPYFYLIYPYQMIVFPYLLTYIFLQYDSYKKIIPVTQTV
jgi:hypothetical protein